MFDKANCKGRYELMWQRCLPVAITISEAYSNSIEITEFNRYKFVFLRQLIPYNEHTLYINWR